MIALPPPNVTGELHMGHALNGSIQDTLMRLRRMQGRETLWICGTDHASIAVHAVIEKQLRAEGLTRHDLGREAFIERVWEWRRETGATIIQQFKRLGCTLDYEHERFTMDEGYVRAVLEMFVRLYRKRLIYRDNRIVNWCPGCGSTVSDLEVRYEHAADALYEVRYRIAGSDELLTVATVRPETILADTAVAVHPDDERYRHLVGGTAIVPIVEREVPIIADEYVKIDFGTGALKITPGHDPNDFEIGRRHGLAELTGDRLRRPHDRGCRRVRRTGRGRGAPEGGRPPVRGRAAAKRAALRARGRPLRPLRRPHRAADLAAVVHADGDAGGAGQRRGAGRNVRFIPASQASHLLQLDGQHPALVRLAAALVGPPDPGLVLPGRPCHGGRSTRRRPAPSAAPPELERDPDVLDTWFSSALWPFATLGWPEQTERLARVLSRPRRRHRPRHHQPVGGADADDGHRVHGRAAVQRRLHHLDHPGPPTAAACPSRSAPASTRST